ncbi:MAG TPA: hypothetical protein VFL86_10080, partial [Burkholderiaceae bacterium]|nr:hypothetical protein [Burkholderiaceae bacterium]
AMPSVSWISPPTPRCCEAISRKTPGVFHEIASQPRGVGGEIQLTDGIASLLRREKVFAYRYEGHRHDCGSKEGFLQANVELALAHPQLGPGFRDYLKGLDL